MLRGAGRPLLLSLACLASVACSSSDGAAVDASLGRGPDAGGPDANGSTDDAGDPRRVCVGVRPEESAWLAEPGPLRAPEPDGGVADPDAGSGCAPAACIGADAPTWALRDFQAQSCGEGATYGLDVFRGKVTVVALLAAW